MKNALILEDIDILQILDGLECRAELWERTVQYLRSDYVDGDIAECSDPRDALSTLRHYKKIIRSIRKQI